MSWLIMKKSVLIGIAIFAVLGIISLFFDSQISIFFQSLRSTMPDYFFMAFAFELQTILILFILTSLFMFKEKKSRWILPLWAAAFFSLFVSYIIKIAFMRLRPFQEEIVIALPIAREILGNGINLWNYSFPSFQAVLAFSALPALDREFRKFKYFWLVLASLIALSRVYFGVHYLSDIIFGAILGYLIGYFAVVIQDKYGRTIIVEESKNKKVKKKLKK